MKTYSPLALLLLLASCNPDKPATTTARQPPANQPAPQAAATATATSDTLAVADSLGHRVAVLQLRPSTKAAFEKLSAGPLPARPSDQENQSNIPDAPLPADGRVQRQGELLILRPAQGPALTLKPEPPSEEGPEGRNLGYYYWGSLPLAHQWVVDVSTDEGSAVLLVDQRTGRRTTVLGAPSVSPDGRYLLSVCEDMISGGTPTEISLYRCGSGAPQLLWARDPQRWGPRAARWRDARHVVLQQALPDADPTADVSTAAARARLTYAELELPAQP